MRRLIVAVVATVITTASFGQTVDSGAIVGKFTSSGTELSGVTVEVRSAALQGVRRDTTRSDGSFRLTLLPPGSYRLDASLEGFGSVSHRGIEVRLASTVTLDVSMQPVTSSEIMVSAAAPLVDVKSTITGIDIANDAMAALPLGRRFTDVAQLAPGVRRTDVGPSFNGSSGVENQYLVDGLNVTGIQYGTDEKPVNLDYVQEVHVMTSGLSAEFGRTTGGIISAITKSGSNDFSGGVFGYTTNRNLTSRAEFLNHLSEDAPSYSQTKTSYDLGGNLGGFFVKDRLWFFGALDRTQRRDVQVQLLPVTVGGYSITAGAETPTDTRSDLTALKLTYAITNNQSAYVSFFGDPGDVSGAIRVVQGPPSTWKGTRTTGGTNYLGRYSAVLSSNSNVNAMAGHDVERSSFVGPGANTPLTRDLSRRPELRSGGFGKFTNTYAERDVAQVDTSLFAWRNHAFKAGIDAENVHFLNRAYWSGGDRVVALCAVALVNRRCPDGQTFYSHTGYVTGAVDPSDATTFSSARANPLTYDYATRDRSAYVQDSWSVLTTLTINAGLRFDRQSVIDQSGDVGLSIGTLSPRLGAIWDPSGSGHQRLYAFFGRFAETFGTDIGRAFGAVGAQLLVYNLDASPGDFVPDPNAPEVINGNRFAAFTIGWHELMDSNMKGQYSDESMIGYDRDIARGFVLGVTATYRNLSSAVEDIGTDSTFTQFIMGNPGFGHLKNSPTVSGGTIPTKKPIRRYTGAELHASKRWNGRSQLFFSYLWSHLYGNYDGTYSETLGQLADHTSLAYDYGDSLVNNYGLLAGDRRHQLKLAGSYEWTRSTLAGLTGGISAHYSSGAPLTLMNSGNFYPYFLTPRGGLGRGPSDYEADVHLSYALRLSSVRSEVLADVFNVFDRQAPVTLDTLYNGYYAPVCTGFADGTCNGDGGFRNVPGTTKAVGRITSPRSTAPNPNFLQPTSWSPARSIRLGVRMSF